MKSKKERVVVFIDGFNLYHAIAKNPSLKQFKWYNLRKLADQFIDPSKQCITEVFYFSAYCHWNNDKVARHKIYISFLKRFGVSTILGNFSQVEKTFLGKKMRILSINPFFLKWLQFLFPIRIRYQTFEEKQTDVNIAVKIVEYGFRDFYDHVFLISGDSDLVSAVKTIKKRFPEKLFTSILPPKSKGKIIQKVCDYATQITVEDLRNSQLPKQINTAQGVLKKPKNYK